MFFDKKTFYQLQFEFRRLRLTLISVNPHSQQNEEIENETKK